MAKPQYSIGDPCPMCSKGIMVKRSGKFGFFMSCDNYKNGCKHTGNCSTGRGAVQKTAAKAPASHEPKPARVWSTWQLAAFAWVASVYKHCILLACAGSGKTTILEEQVKRIHEHHKTNGLPTPKILVLAFNKNIQLVLADRISSVLATIKTLNGYGHGIIAKLAKGRLNMDNWKIKNLVNDSIPATGEEGKPTNEERTKRSAVQDLVALAMCYLQESTEELQELDARHAIGATPDVIVRTQQILKLLRNYKEGMPITFDEQLWLPVVLNLPTEQYDYVLGDEVQDWSAVKLALAYKALKPEGRMIAVGDKNQAIYGFCGALSDSMEQIQAAQEKNGGSLPLALPVTYRCAKAIVREAQEDVPELLARDDAPEGEVKTIMDTKFPELVKENDLVLCRVNAPLVTYCLMLIRSGLKATIMGKDTASWLINFIFKVGSREATTVPQLIEASETYRHKEQQKFAAMKNPGQAMQKLDDLLDTLLALTDGLDTTKQVVDRINTIFGDENNPGIKLSSIHKAKGLEADTVYILMPHLMPHPSATQPWELQQEKNLRYVARTRAKTTLVYVEQTKTGK